MEINNTGMLEDRYVWKDKAGLVTKYLGNAAGSKRIYVNIDSVPPGAYSTKYHSHSSQEEFFLILSGSGTLRLNGKECEVSKGDFISKPAGEGVAHTFYNSGKEALEILDAGTVENEDIVYYPDEEVYLVKSNGENRAFYKTESLKSWTSDPNEKMDKK